MYNFSSFLSLIGQTSQISIVYWDKPMYSHKLYFTKNFSQFYFFLSKFVFQLISCLSRLKPAGNRLNNRKKRKNVKVRHFSRMNVHVFTFFLGVESLVAIFFEKDYAEFGDKVESYIFLCDCSPRQVFSYKFHTQKATLNFFSLGLYDIALSTQTGLFNNHNNIARVNLKY